MKRWGCRPLWLSAATAVAAVSVPWQRAAGAVCLAGLALAACREAPPPPSSAAAASAGAAVTVRGRVNAQAPELALTLIADASPGAEGLLRVRAIEVRRAGAAELLQRIDGLATETPWTADVPGLEWLDMNFDGHADLRLMAFRPAGPNTPYLNWLYEPASDRFVANAALDEITSPEFDAARRVVRSSWRDGAARHGTDTHAYVEGLLVPQTREVTETLPSGQSQTRAFRWRGGVWQAVTPASGQQR